MTKQEKIEKIEDLPGVGPATAEKLASAGFTDLMNIAVMPVGSLSETAGVSDSVSRKIIQAARDSLEMGFETGIKVEKKREKVTKISTGSKAFDELLDGGFETGAITEFYGEFGSGKTQMSHILAVNCQIDDPKAIAVYIDTENTFRPKRIRQLAEGVGLDPDKVLKNILVAKSFNSDHQMLLAEKINDLIKDETNIKVVIVDSLMAHFRSEYIGRGTLSERQQKINKHLKFLAKIADINNICVYITNQVMSDPGAFFGDPTKPIGGHIVGHACIEINSIVITNKGFKKIGEVNVGDKIYNGEKFVNVNNVSEIKEKEVFEIKSNGYIIASKDHKFPVVGEGDLQVKDMKNGQFLESPLKINIKQKDIEIHPNVEFLVRPINKFEKLIRSNKILLYDNEKIIGITKRQIRRIMNQEYPTKLNILNNIAKLLNFELKKEDFILVDTYKHRNEMLPDIVTKEIIRLYGAWLCDGDKSSSKSIRIRKQEKEYLEYLGKLVEKYKLNSNITKIPNKNCYQLDINSTKLINIFKEFDDNKLIFLKDDLLIEFCAALIDGDGSIYKHNITFSNTKYDLILMLQMLLMRFKIQSNIRRLPLGGFSKNVCYELYITGKYKKILFNSMVNKKKKDKFVFKNKIKKENNIHKIKNINKIGIRKVIDISVDGEYFICNGIKTHNSTFRVYLRKGKKGSRVAKLVDSPDLPEGECNFIVEESGLKDV